MKSFIIKDYAPNKRNLFVWFNAIFLIVLLLSGRADSLTIVTAYFLETIIIGIVNTFKMYSIISFDNSKHHDTSGFSNYSMILFFLFHYGFFIAVQLVFVFVFIGMTDNHIKEAFYLLKNLKYVLSYNGMILVLISIMAYNFADYILNFIIPKRYKTSSLNTVFTEPYVRIFVQQFTVILSCFFIIFSSGILIVAVILIIFRTLIELYFIANPTNNIIDGNQKPII